MQRYYSNAIPNYLIKKLNNVGFNIEKPTYADIFDWFLEKGFSIEMSTDFGYWYCSLCDSLKGTCLEYHNSQRFDIAANKIIERAIKRLE